MKRLLAFMLVVLALAYARQACARSVGAEPFNFLFLDANARPVAMSGAYTALAADANALLYNPAGLAIAPQNEVTFMHNQHFEGITQEYVGFAHTLGWGLNLNFLNSGSIPKTTISNPEGTGLGDTSMSDLAFSGGYAHRFGEDLSLGSALKFIREAIAGYNGQAVALDMGAMYSVSQVKGLALGMALQNIGPKVKFQGTDENLPLNLRLGGGYSFSIKEQKSTVSMDMTKERSEGALIAFGVETIIAKALPIRLGFNTRNNAGPGVTAGLGWIYENFGFDYAFVPYGDLGIAHRISVSWRWGEKGEKPEEKTERVDSRPPQLAPEARSVSTAAPEGHFRATDDFIQIGLLDFAKDELKTVEPLIGQDDGVRVGYLTRLGRIASAEKDCPKAKSHFTEAIRLAVRLRLSSADAAEAYAGMGLCLEQENNIPYAVKFYTKALEAGPSNNTRRLIQKRLGKLQPEEK